MMPLRAKERFGWWDAEERISRSAGGSAAPTHRDRVVAWLREASEPGDAAARDEVDRCVAAGAKASDLPRDLEERATRANLRDYPDHGRMLMRLWDVIGSRGGQVPDGLPIHALRSRFAELSRATTNEDPDDRARERLEIERELTILEVFDHGTNGDSIAQLLLSGEARFPDAAGYAKLARELARRHDFDAAEVAYLLAIELDPASPSLHRSLADVIDANGRSKEAIEILQLLASQTPGDVGLHARLGHLLTQEGDFARAEAAYRRALEIEPDSGELRRRLADVLDANGRSKEAIEILQLLAAQAPRDGELQARLGHVLIRSGDLDRAEAVLRVATALDAAPIGAQCDLADVVAAKGRPEAAIDMLKALAAQGIRDAQLHARLGLLLQRCGDLNRAEDALRRAIELDPGNPSFGAALAAIAGQKEVRAPVPATP